MIVLYLYFNVIIHNIVFWGDMIKRGVRHESQ